MEITNLLNRKTTCLSLKGKSKSEVIDELIQILDKAGKLRSKSKFKEAILRREAEFSTGLENGIAIPHARTDAVKEPAIAFGISKQGVDYGSLDNQPSKIFFLIAETEEVANAHLEILSTITRHMKDENYVSTLLHASNADELIHFFKAEAEAAVTESKVATHRPQILAVTACPTGIAHTYMAADALKNKAKELNIPIKVETNGAIGAKNKLTDEDIEHAYAIIVAADAQVDMGRFIGKKVIETSVREGIQDPETLLNRALRGDCDVYTPTKDNIRAKLSQREKTGLYKHLMNGVSNMLPFVVGGGILMALSFMFGINAFNPEAPSFSPVAKLLMDLGGNSGAFGLMVPVLAGFIGLSIADRPGFMPAMVGGFLSVQLGGGFLGGIVAGLLGGYVVQLIKRACYKIPDNLQGIETVLIYPVFGLLITGTLMYFILMPLATINTGLVAWLNDLGMGNLILLGLLLGGLMAVDLGGPVNKASFTFGIAAIEAGNYLPHAAVMAGGMVPPIAMGLATQIFRNKFSENELKAGKTCFVLGASFITEGAIPFAAADPLRVLPACIAGSALAGGLSMLFGCQLMAPHGGVFVIPLVENPLLYVLAILLGSLLATAIVGILKKPIIPKNSTESRPSSSFLQ